MLGALSIDLDGLEHYHRIHGLAERPTGGDDPVYGAAVERFGELCARLHVRGTAFCIGRSLEAPRAAAAVAALARAGHELANHSLSHPYALSRLAPDATAHEVRGGADAIERACGKRPVGFRAPGYAMSARLLAALVRDGYRYDSSAFPAPMYYAAKAAVMGLLALRREPSGAILDRPRVLFAPAEPYRPRSDEPYARGASPIVELPIATGLLGFPLIGTAVATLPRAVRLLAGAARRRTLFNLELHGVDLLDASDCPGPLADRQRDLRVPAATKVARIERFVRGMTAEREWVTLAEAAERVGPTI
jgi:hypothetical protein